MFIKAHKRVMRCDGCAKSCNTGDDQATIYKETSILLKNNVKDFKIRCIRRNTAIQMNIQFNIKKMEKKDSSSGARTLDISVDSLTEIFNP